MEDMIKKIQYCRSMDQSIEGNRLGSETESKTRFTSMKHRLSAYRFQFPWTAQNHKVVLNQKMYIKKKTQLSVVSASGNSVVTEPPLSLLAKRKIEEKQLRAA
ncbi:hypothetical protein L6164_000624 [Bauhinia variegata]|uniref:Uncharacterized protein n=1 Tax=Bauhinia variegata TaxID=167791 RepID=A0ACB9QCX8_BAUVA|nr:hypothetical protein L6164_000624 [Bauhinia variegata]